MIDEDGLQVERTEYYPYGQVQSGGLEKYGFTGKENDADTGLMYYGARYSSPEFRIFVQPDTMLPDPYNPQYLNRYAYCLNNPVKYNDPSGHIVETLIDAYCLYHSTKSFINDPNVISGAFLLWDITATVVPGMPASWVIKAPKAVQKLHKFLSITGDLETAEKYVYKFHSIATGWARDEVVDLDVHNEQYEHQKNMDYLKQSFGDYVPQNFNFEGSLRAYYTTEDGQKFDTLYENGYLLYGFNKEKTKALWLSVDGDVQVEYIGEEIEEEEEDE